MDKYEDQIRRLRDSEHEIDCSLCDRDCCYPDGKVHGKCIIIEAADAIEALSKTEKTTQEQPSHSPSLGYYYAFEFDETTGETYMPKEET